MTRLTANPWRGEVEITINRKSYLMRPTFGALCRIEQQLNTGIITLAEKLSAGQLTVGELSVIMMHCLHAASPSAVTETALRKALANGTLMPAAHAVSTMFCYALGGLPPHDQT